MIRSLFIITSIMMQFFVSGSDANAAGIGLFGTYGAGRSDWEPRNELSFKKDTNHSGGGFAFDSAPDGNHLFNYQMNLGYDRFINDNSKAWGRAEFEGIALSNCFGFGGKIAPGTRLWFGPEIRLEWADGKPDAYPDYTIRMFGVGIGPVIGFNFNPGDNVTLSFKTGYQYVQYHATGDGFYDHLSNTSPSTSHHYGYDVTEKMVYATFSILFRTSGD